MTDLCLPPICSGSVKLDAELGGGYPRGQITTVYYEDHTDPWQLIMLAMKETIEADLQVGIVSIIPPDPQRWKNVGIDISRIMVAEAPNLENVEDALIAAREEHFDLVVIDTLNAVNTGTDGLINWVEHQALTRKMKSILRLPDAAVILMRIPPRKCKGGAPKYAEEDENAMVVTSTKKTTVKLHIVSKGTNLPRTFLEINADPTKIDYNNEMAHELGMKPAEMKALIKRQAIQAREFRKN